MLHKLLTSPFSFQIWEDLQQDFVFPSTRLCQIPMSPTPFPCVNNMEFTSGMFTSKVNIQPFLSPFAISLPWFFTSSIKHPLGLNVTCKPCSTIWPMESIFFLLWLEHEVHISSTLFAHLAWTMAPY